MCGALPPTQNGTLEYCNNMEYWNIRILGKWNIGLKCYYCVYFSLLLGYWLAPYYNLFIGWLAIYHALVCTLTLNFYSWELRMFFVFVSCCHVARWP